MPAQPVSQELPTIVEALRRAARYALEIEAYPEQPAHRLDRWASLSATWANVALALAAADQAASTRQALGLEPFPIDAPPTAEAVADPDDFQPPAPPPKAAKGK